MTRAATFVLVALAAALLGGGARPAAAAGPIDALPARLAAGKKAVEDAVAVKAAQLQGPYLKIVKTANLAIVGNTSVVTYTNTVTNVGKTSWLKADKVNVDATLVPSVFTLLLVFDNLVELNFAPGVNVNVVEPVPDLVVFNPTVASVVSLSKDLAPGESAAFTGTVVLRFVPTDPQVTVPLLNMGSVGPTPGSTPPLPGSESCNKYTCSSVTVPVALNRQSAG